MLTLVTGGARSGKSRFAEAQTSELARQAFQLRSQTFQLQDQAFQQPEPSPGQKGQLSHYQGLVSKQRGQALCRQANDNAPIVQQEIQPLVVYVATAQAYDEEMRARIMRHRRLRADSWETVEAPLELFSALHGLRMRDHPPAAVLVDCMTLYWSNLLHKVMTGVVQGKRAPGPDLSGTDLSEAQWYQVAEQLEVVMAQELDRFAQEIRQYPFPLVMVTNEVGWGVVPPTPMGRVYRDCVGWGNQRLAALSDEVYLVAAGIPLKLKPPGVQTPERLSEGF